MLTWGESHLKYKICLMYIGSVGFELGTIFYLLESLAGLFCVDMQENFP